MLESMKFQTKASSAKPVFLRLPSATLAMICYLDFYATLFRRIVFDSRWLLKLKFGPVGVIVWGRFVGHHTTSHRQGRTMQTRTKIQFLKGNMKKQIQCQGEFCANENCTNPAWNAQFKPKHA